MDYMRRQASRFLLRCRLSETFNTSFQDLFADLMTANYGGDYQDIRTAGSMGDYSADGILGSARTLFACYAPEVFNHNKAVAKFKNDLDGAIKKRDSEFDTFAFVHNDLRGIHPAITVTMNNERVTSVKQIHQYGFRKLSELLVCLEQAQVEDILKAPLSVQDMTFSLTLHDLEPILELVRTHRRALQNHEPVKPVPVEKLDFNEISGDFRDELVEGLRLQPVIDEYYRLNRDPLEKDEVANGFQSEYKRLSEEYSQPEDVMWRLTDYVLGNASLPPRDLRAASAIIAYFFWSCHIFDEPTKEWLAKRRLTA